jgi:penicillin-binding protein 1A
MSRRERHRRRRRNKGGPHRAILLTAALVATVLAIAGLASVGYVVSIAASAPDLSKLKPKDQGATSVVYAANDERLGFIRSDVLRTPIASSQIPQTLKDGTVAIEDRRFYAHKGVDPEGVVRAALKNFNSGKTVEGGSTLTMQLIKNLYTEDRTKQFKRKIREARLASDLEHEHPGRKGKNWILTKYINNVPYGTVGGQNAIGIQAAARIYFDKPASRLKLHEAAMLAGLPQAPTDYSPFLHPARALARRNDVLRKMTLEGYVQRSTAERAMERPLGVEKSRYYTFRREGYFFEYVRKELAARYGERVVRRGGLSVWTTADTKLQDAARKAMAGRLGDPSRAAAIVSIDPRTGYLKAMATSRKYGDLKFNVAAQGKRQAGSTFKPIVLMAALRQGVDPLRTSYDSKPLKFNDPTYGPIDVANYGNSYGGRRNLVEGIVRSDNSVFQQLDLDVGPDKVRQTAYDLGITTKLDAYPSEGLGAVGRGISPLELARAYTTIASGGWRYKVKAITKVCHRDTGKCDDLSKPQRTRAFEDGVTDQATKILRQNIQRGTGVAANIGCPAAGKTGTTDKNTDAWFAGYTPRLTTVSWLGDPYRLVPMPGITGGTFPAQMWKAFMDVAKGKYCGDFPKPKVAFKAAPFFGRYSKTGVRKNSAPYPVPGGAGAGAAGGGTGGRRYPPKAYETPPQKDPKAEPAPKEAPKTPAPAPATPPPGGGGGGAEAPQ